MEQKLKEQRMVNLAEDVVPFDSKSDSSLSPIIGRKRDTSGDKKETFEPENKLTRKGVLRKRKRYDVSLAERMQIKKDTKKAKHGLKRTCSEKCKFKCRELISEERRASINAQYWELCKRSQQAFVLHHVDRKLIKRRTVPTADVAQMKKSATFNYFLKNVVGIRLRVCKIFFLATLGYDSHDDRFMRSITSDKNKAKITTPKRNDRTAVNKVDRNVIVEHINLFKPTISHYRREHAPNRRYLPSDITIVSMHKSFSLKYPNIKISYSLYRQIIFEENISFVKLGHEECFHCESVELHVAATDHSKEDQDSGCEICKKWNCHIRKAKESREEYRKDGEYQNENDVVYSADLQKVIMLPRLEMFKEAIFAHRIIAFNESFVPVGRNPDHKVPHAVIWHEATAGRGKCDIISAFYKFILHNRDANKIILWLDNCSAQNKNWALFCFFTYIVNTHEIATQMIEIKYFEPGYTFMIADSFHHQVELSMKKKLKLYDFSDFKECVQRANSGKVMVSEMEVHHFNDWADSTSQHKLKKTSVRPYLHDMVNIIFSRGKRTFQYRNNFEDQYTELNFLTAKCSKSGLPPPSKRELPRGVTADRKRGITEKLSGVIPENRLQFWINLPVTQVERIDDNDD